MSTFDSVTKDYMVYLDTHDTYPQRLRLRMMEDRNLDGLLWQIERQLTSTNAAEGGASQLTFPLESTNCEVFVSDPRDNAFVPYANATFDTLKATSKVLILPRRSDDASDPVAARALEDAPEGDEKTSEGQKMLAVSVALSKLAASLKQNPTQSAAEWAENFSAELGRVADETGDVDTGVLKAFQAALSPETAQ